MIRLILTGGCAGDAAHVVRKALTFGVVLLALAPATHLAWVAREMPHFGHLHDDSIYFVCAKSLAEGRGYRILSLPAEPYQTKYPPLWPLALATIWKLDPHFPENLRWGMALAWTMLPAFVGLAWWWFQRAGFGSGVSAGLCVVIALSPCAIVLSAGLMSDLVFSVALLAAVLGIDSAEGSNGWAAVAGLLAGAAYLIKTAALPLIVARPLWLALRKKWRAAALMFGAMLPAVAGWMLWSRAHMLHARDLVSLYYTDYLGYQVLNVTWRDLPVVMWKNLDGVLAGIAELLIFDLGKTPLGMHLARFLAIVVIAGTVRLARLRGMTVYHWFAVMYTGILLVWHFPPNNRFLLPLFSLLLAGLYTEAANLAGVIRSAWVGGLPNRVVAVAIVTGIASVAVFGVVSNARATFRGIPGIINQHREVLASNRAAFAWIGQHTHAGNFYAYDDPVFYLYTGRHAASLPVAPQPFYREDREAILRPFRAMSEFAREQNIAYFLFTAADFHRDLPDAERSEVRRILASDPSLETVYRSALSSVAVAADERAIPDTERVEFRTPTR